MRFLREDSNHMNEMERRVQRRGELRFQTLLAMKTVRMSALLGPHRERQSMHWAGGYTWEFLSFQLIFTDELF